MVVIRSKASFCAIKDDRNTLNTSWWKPILIVQVGYRSIQAYNKRKSLIDEIDK